MPTAPYATYGANSLQPIIDPGDARTINVAIVASQTIARGTVLGMVTASGKYQAYVDAAVDGSGVAQVIAQYDMTTDASGNVTILGDPNLATAKVAPVWWKGTFKISELVGLDAAAVADLKARLLLTNDPVPASSTGYLVLH
jgi:hypothetical protein